MNVAEKRTRDERERDGQGGERKSDGGISGWRQRGRGRNKRVG